MLGCHDFCGYYDWTFHYLRRRFGEEALQRYWREAIASDSQRHYIEAAQKEGLRGLYNCWDATGESEQCDWTVALDEAAGTLRLDMRSCPSKGFLLDRDLNADEDYCNHCMGWIGPALDQAGAEVVAHEHNHCGQCWWQIGLAGASVEPTAGDADIRNDPRWQQGYVHRYVHQLPVADVAQNSHVDPVETIQSACADSEALLVVGDRLDVARHRSLLDAKIPSMAVASVYPRLIDAGFTPRIVVIGQEEVDWPRLAATWDATPVDQKPLVLHSFLPPQQARSFLQHGLPRPLPLLPILIRHGGYRHRPGGPHPTAIEWIDLLATALDKRVRRIGC